MARAKQTKWEQANQRERAHLYILLNKTMAGLRLAKMPMTGDPFPLPAPPVEEVASVGS